MFMAEGHVSAMSGWIGAARKRAQERPFTAYGLAISAIAVLVLLGQSLFNIITSDASDVVYLAFMGGLVACAATTVGAIPVIVIKRMPQKMSDTMLGFAAGMMLAACAFSLILPGVDAAMELFNNTFMASGTVVAGMGLGVLLMLGLEQFTPHVHESSGRHGPGAEVVNRGLLFIFAIILHNLPEGMAIGVAFSQGDMSVGVPLTTAISIQDVPEGLAVALAARSVGYSIKSAAGIGFLSGAIEPIGALIGVGLSTGMAIAYPLGLGLAAGAMLFVVSHEVIPETHRNGHQTPATLGLMGGFALMMVLDVALG